MRAFGITISGNRRPNCQLTNEQTIEIVTGDDAGARRVEVAELFNLCTKKITLVIQRYNKNGTTRRQQASGRPEKFNRREKRYLIQFARRFPAAHYKDLLAVTDTSVCHKTM